MKAFIGPYPNNADRSRTIWVEIDPWDTWSMDYTLAHIILPMLKQLKAKQNGAPHTDDEDVPIELRRSSAPPVEEWVADENYGKRWNWIVDEMIFAFESKMVEDNDTFGSDCVTNGFKLFGKYYEALWT
jgi:hypothetical protein